MSTISYNYIVESPMGHKVGIFNSEWEAQGALIKHAKEVSEKMELSASELSVLIDNYSIYFNY